MSKKALALEDVYRTLSPEPLDAGSEFHIDLDELRGQSLVGLFALKLSRVRGGGRPFQALLTSHPGAGKSTELARLQDRVKDQFAVIRFSVLNELDPQNFKAFDVLILSVLKLVEATREQVGEQISTSTLEKFMDWFARERTQVKRSFDVEGKLEAGAGLKGSEFWAKLLGLFANLKGEMKYATHRDAIVERERFSRLSELIALANGIIQSCSNALYDKSKRRWLLIGEDFEKEGINPDRSYEFFINYNHVLRELDCHWIFTLPVSLAYSAEAQHLPCVPQHLHDIPVFMADQKTPHQEGREALRQILAARMDLKLIEDGLVEELITACGGNLRDLFMMINQATDEAILANEKVVTAVQVRREISRMCDTYERRLGQTLHDRNKVSYAEKSARLVDLYHNLPEARVPDPVLSSLLYARLVQEFRNGHIWSGVHPLAIQVLDRHGALSPTDEQGP